MKKILGVLFGLLLTVLAMPMAAVAAGAESAATYRYELSIDGQEEKTVKTGDIITVVLRLQKTDTDEAYTMYSMQDEIRYDSRFFELVEDSKMLSSGVRSTDVIVDENYREVYMNFVSFNNATTWGANAVVGSFQLRVVAEKGSTKITNEDYRVSLQDGSGSYSCEANELTITVSNKPAPKEEPAKGEEFDFKWVFIGLAIMAGIVLLTFIVMRIFDK